MKRTVLFLLLTSRLFSQTMPSAIPVVPGTTWIYAGTMKWADQRTNEEHAKAIRWSSTITAIVSRHSNVAAQLHGYLLDLAFYSPGDKPKDWVLVLLEGTYYVERDEGAVLFKKLQASPAERWLQIISPESIFFSDPIQDGGKYCGPSVTGRDDTMYCWHVNHVSTERLDRLHGAGKEPKRVYELWLLTNPDTQIIGLAPGIGIVSYFYQHHGTVSEAEVKLVDFHPGK